jgi:hypothetical protein
MRKASTELLDQGTQTPSPAPDLIPAEPNRGLTLGLVQQMGALQDPTRCALRIGGTTGTIAHIAARNEEVSNSWTRNNPACLFLLTPRLFSGTFRGNGVIEQSRCVS